MILFFDIVYYEIKKPAETAGFGHGKCIAC